MGDEQKDGCRCLVALRKSIHHVGLEHCKVQAEKPGNGAEILRIKDCKRYIHLRDDNDTALNVKIKVLEYIQKQTAEDSDGIVETATLEDASPNRLPMIPTRGSG